MLVSLKKKQIEAKVRSAIFEEIRTKNEEFDEQISSTKAYVVLFGVIFALIGWLSYLFQSVQNDKT